MTPAFDPTTAPTPGLRRRMACWLYEGLLLFGVIFVAAYLFGTLSQTRHALDHRLGLQAFVALVVGIYFTWFWSKGQTLAMKTWHIRVVDRHGMRLGQGRALARYAASWAWFWPPLALTWPLQWPASRVAWLWALWVLVWAALSRAHPSRQFWHDALAGTRLIDVSPAAQAKSQAKAPFSPSHTP